MSSQRKIDSLRQVTSLTRSLFHKLSALAQSFHEGDFTSVSERAILEDLFKNGAQTIAALARKRPVSRQHIRNIVHPLEERSDVEFIENTAHKRSFLVQLTKSGQSKIRSMLRAEENLLGELSKTLTVASLHTTEDTLRTIGDVIDNYLIKSE